MTNLQIVLSVLCLLVAVLLVVLIVRDRRPGRVTYVLLAVLEVGLVAELVLGLVRVFGDHEGVSVAPYVGYLVGALVILPLAAGWAWAERTRNGTGVLLVGVLVLPVLFVRLHDLWSTHV
jgi:lipopolysaccharide export LptBFGC system permease protein LptF